MKWSLDGWDVKSFFKGRKKLLIAVIGGLAGWIATADPTYTLMASAGADFLYAVIEYFVKNN